VTLLGGLGAAGVVRLQVAATRAGRSFGAILPISAAREAGTPPA
jgi:hypothetical protein